MKATGGTISYRYIDSVLYKVHTFTTSDNFIVTESGSATILAISHGGRGYLGGGGGGGYIKQVVDNFSASINLGWGAGVYPLQVSSAILFFLPDGSELQVNAGGSGGQSAATSSGGASGTLDGEPAGNAGGATGPNTNGGGGGAGEKGQDAYWANVPRRCWYTNNVPPYEPPIYWAGIGNDYSDSFNGKGGDGILDDILGWVCGGGGGGDNGPWDCYTGTDEECGHQTQIYKTFPKAINGQGGGHTYWGGGGQGVSDEFPSGETGGPAVCAVFYPANLSGSLTVSPLVKYLNPGRIQQYTATLHLDDGSTADVTLNSTWTSSNPLIASVNLSTGLAKTIRTGDTAIIARFGDLIASGILIVVNATSLRGGEISGTGIYAFASLKGVYRNAEYLTKRHKYKAQSLSVIKVLASSYPVSVDIVYPKIPYTVTVEITSEKPQRMKSLLTDCCEVRVYMNAEISAIFLSSTMEEIPL